MSAISILVAVNGAPDDDQAIAIGADMARRHKSMARVVNTFAPIPMVTGAPAFAGGVMAPQVWQALEERQEAVQFKIEAAVRHAAERFQLNDPSRCGGLSLASSQDTPWATLMHELPLTDLVVLSQTNAVGDGPWTGALGQALMEARVPVYIARDEVSVAGRPAAIAWDGSFEAARAVRSALPILRDASEVAILQDPVGLDTDQDSRADPRRLMAFLTLHGVGAQTVAHAHGRKVGPTLLKAAKNFGAALLVSGAYRHSRLEEALFGGATKAFLSEAGGPHLLIAH